MKKVFFCRAMDSIEYDEIKAQYIEINNLLKDCGMELTNEIDISHFIPVNEKEQNDISAVAESIVNYDLEKIKKSDFLLVDLSLPNHFYFGSICEIVYAHLWNKVVVVFTGDSKNESRIFLHYHADYICKTLNDAIEYLKNYENK